MNRTGHKRRWSIAIGMLLLFGGPASALAGDGLHVDLPAWDRAIPAAKRFIVLSDFNNQAVLDRETGLVWERSPQLQPTFPTMWSSATFSCAEHSTGGRMGWRLPSLHELASLLDPSVPAPGPTLPVGHPFTNVQALSYWSASARADDPVGAWGVDLLDGTVHAFGKGDPHLGWCVRGAGPLEVY